MLWYYLDGLNSTTNVDHMIIFYNHNFHLRKTLYLAKYDEKKTYIKCMKKPYRNFVVKIFNYLSLLFNYLTLKLIDLYFKKL